MKLLRSFALLCSFLVFQIACQSEKELKAKSQMEFLQGSWELGDAYRNERRTSTMEGAHMTFAADSIHTNILGTELSSKYRLNQDSIHQEYSPFGPITYVIISDTDSTFSLHTSIKRQPFLFEFTRNQ